jgi:amino acid adenylation domain-containing protein
MLRYPPMPTQFQPTTLATLVGSAAFRFPDRPAVRSGDSELSWSELDTACGQVASCLKSGGLTNGDRVAILLNKSVRSSIALHGILRTGAVYVAVDPFAPADHLAAVLADSGSRAIITEPRHHRTVAAALKRLREQGRSLPWVVGLSDPFEAGDVTKVVSWGDVQILDPIEGTRVVEDDLAYIIYTSGSTGKPKGIMHTHRSGMAFATRARDLFAVTETDVLANLAPLHFDISTFEMFTGPLAGASTVLVPEPYLKMPASLSELIEKERATFWYSVPSLLAELVYRGGVEQRDLSSLRWVLFAGEVASSAVIRKLIDLLPGANFSNNYGPAEVNCCTYFNLDSSAPPDGDIPIGSPWPDADLVIVDEAGNRVTTGETGELWVRTPHLMAGYWNKPELTAGSIRSVSGEGGRQTLWYITGDLVWEDSEGVVHFVGRRDHQVKVRGNRVELEAVEAVLADLPGVAHAVVGVVGEGHEAKLVAAVVLHATESVDAKFDTKPLLRAVAVILPPYATPDEIVVWPHFPLTSSGKTDKRGVRNSLLIQAEQIHV